MIDLEALARRQHGVVSRAQALESGMTAGQVRARLASGRWQRIHAGVYATHTGPVDWWARASAALLHSGVGAALSMAAAAHVWGWHDAPAMVHLAVPAHRHPRRVVGVRVRRRRRLQTEVVRGLRVTARAQTVLDLAAVPGSDLDGAVALVSRVVQRGRPTVAELLDELVARPGHPLRTGLRDALAEVGDGIESAAEHRFVTRVQRPHGLPEFERQVAAPDGTRRDFFSARHRVAVEVDGRLWHAGDRFHTDRARDRRAAARGEVVVRAAWIDVSSRPCELAADLAEVLRTRGWPGTPASCGVDCRLADVGR